MAAKKTTTQKPVIQTRPNTTSSIRTFSKTDKTGNNSKNKKG